MKYFTFIEFITLKRARRPIAGGVKGQSFSCTLWN